MTGYKNVGEGEPRLGAEAGVELVLHEESHMANMAASSRQDRCFGMAWRAFRQGFESQRGVLEEVEMHELDVDLRGEEDEERR